MDLILIKDTTREERERIVAESIGDVSGSCDGCMAGLAEMPPLAQTYLGDNLLHLAAKYDWMGLAKLMLKYQKDIDVIGQEGCTALGYALYFGNYDMARFLVRHGANIDVPDELLGKSARQWAQEMLMDLYGCRH